MAGTKIHRFISLSVSNAVRSSKGARLEVIIQHFHGGLRRKKGLKSGAKLFAGQMSNVWLLTFVHIWLLSYNAETKTDHESTIRHI